MKFAATTLISVLALAAPLAAHAGPAIDLKKIVKDSVKDSVKPQDQAGSADASNSPGAPLRKPGAPPDSDAVAAVIAKLKPVDVGGIRIGMHIDEARKLALKWQPGFKFQPTTQEWYSSQFSGIKAEVRSTNSLNRAQTENVVLLYNETGAVFFVARVIGGLSPEKYVQRDVFLRSVADKFDAQGFNTVAHPPRTTYIIWRYDMNGKLSMPGDGPDMDDPCKGDMIASAGFLNAMVTDTTPRCALRIMAHMSTEGSNPNVLSGYSVSIAAPWMAHDSNAVRAKAGAAEAQRRAEENRAKGNAPQL